MDTLSSGADWLKDTVKSGGEYLQDTVDGWTDGKSGDGKAIDAITDQNDGGLMSSYFQNDNGEFGPQNKIDGFSEVKETNQIEPVIGETDEVGETNADGTPETKPFNPLGEYDNRKINPEYGAINEAVGDGSLMDAGGHMGPSMEPGASGGTFKEEFTGPWSSEVYDQKKRDAGFNAEGNQSVDQVKQNVSDKGDEIVNAKNEEDKKKADMQGRMQEFGKAIQEAGAQYSKNPYEYKPW